MVTEKVALQIAVIVACIVPVSGGAAGVVFGPGVVGDASGWSGDADSHFRYLSGLLLGIGLSYLLAVRGIERHRTRFLLLGGIIVVGGLARLASLVVVGAPSTVMMAALIMELVVTPVLTLWQGRVARQAALEHS